MHSRFVIFASIAALFLGSAVGCQSVTPPQFCPPPPLQVQRAEAHRFDPYPENDAGPPIVGGRPLDYKNPPAEPSRARWTTWSRKWLPGR